MSGATESGSDGPGVEGRTSSGPTAVPEGDRGSAADGAGRALPQEPPGEGTRGESTQGGGTTVTDTRQPQPQPQAQPPLPPYQPAQGYPAPTMPTTAQPVVPQDPAGEPPVRRPRTGVQVAPRTRKARLRVAKADPWSVMKVSFMLSLALGICTVVAVAVLWTVMDAMGVFATVGSTISDATGSSEGGGFDLESFLSLPRVLMFTAVIGLIDVVLATALATLGAFVYNLSAGFVGGVELTLAEDE